MLAMVPTSKIGYTRYLCRPGIRIWVFGRCELISRLWILVVIWVDAPMVIKKRESRGRRQRLGRVQTIVPAEFIRLCKSMDPASDSPQSSKSVKDQGPLNTKPPHPNPSQTPQSTTSSSPTLR